MTRNRPIEFTDRLQSVLLKEPDRAFTLTELSEKSRLHFVTVKKYIEFLKHVESMPHQIDIINSGRITMVRLKIGKKEEIEKLREFYPKVSSENELLTQLLDAKAINKEKGIPLENSSIVKKLIKLKRIQKVDDKYYLTHIGKMIAKGIKEIYNK